MTGHTISGNSTCSLSSYIHIPLYQGQKVDPFHPACTFLKSRLPLIELCFLLMISNFDSYLFIRLYSVYSTGVRRRVLAGTKGKGGVKGWSCSHLFQYHGLIATPACKISCSRTSPLQDNATSMSNASDLKGPS